MRLDPDLVETLEAMGDHRDIDFTAMTDRTLRAALATRQRACKMTHTPETRCGECGLLSPPASGNPLERI